MKTTIVIRRDLYERAEKFARDNNISTDRLFSKALKEYLNRRKVYDDEKITDSLNKVYSEVDSSLDPVLLKMASMSLPKDEW
jgi:hypothetical protein